MTWHADDLLAAYRDRDLDAITAASVDAHLVSCDRCRSLARDLDDPQATDALWHDIVDDIDAVPATGIERLLGHLGIPNSIGRLLAATPGLVLATILAAAVSATFGLLLGDVDRSANVATFVALAAVVPAVGVGASFGTAADPAYEVGAAAPLSGLRLVLIRTIPITAVSIAICLIGTLGYLDTGMVAAGWLLPSLALATASLALSTWLPPWTAVSAIVSAWLVAVLLAGRLAGDWLVPFGPSTQVVAVAVAAGAGAIVAIRHPRLDHREI